MALIISLGSNIGNRQENLKSAIKSLEEHFTLISASKIYESTAVDYTQQPNFYNQTLQFELPSMSPEQAITIIHNVEESLGRTRTVPKGPRTIDIDIIFWGTQSYSSPNLVIPHPRLFERSFVVLPLQELPYFSTLINHFEFPNKFSCEAWTI